VPAVDDHEATSQRSLPPSSHDDEPVGLVDLDQPGIVDVLHTSDAADQAASTDNFVPSPPASSVTTAAVDHDPDDNVDGQEADHAAALTAAAEAVVRQSTAAVAPLILASISNVEEPEKHNSAATTL